MISKWKSEGPDRNFWPKHTLGIYSDTDKNELQCFFICGDTPFYKKEKGKMRKKAPYVENLLSCFP